MLQLLVSVQLVIEDCLRFQLLLSLDPLLKHFLSVLLDLLPPLLPVECWFHILVLLIVLVVVSVLAHLLGYPLVAVPYT